MILARLSQTSIVLSIDVTDFQLERKVGTGGTWTPWDGSSWGAVPVFLASGNFTDYNLSDAVYQYRYIVNGGSVYVYSNCVAVGGDPRGWTFYNYSVPEGTFGEILTPDDIRYSFMWGVDFVSSGGREWYDEQTRKCVEWAVYQLEKALNITIYPKTIYSDDDVNAAVVRTKDVLKEFPYSLTRKRNWLIRLNHRPIREVTRLDWYSPVDQKIANLMSWLRLDRDKGFAWVLPKTGALQGYTGYVYPWASMMQYAQYPGGYHIDYTAGFETAELIPEDLREIAGKIATLKMLNVIGDGLIAGFSSSSLSLDGISESFSSTQSATSAYFGARVKVYQDEVKEYIQLNKWKYSNIPLGSI